MTSLTKIKKIPKKQVLESNVSSKSNGVNTVETPVDTFPRKENEEENKYGVFSIDLQGLITNWNKGAEKLFGYAPHEIIGKSCLSLYTFEDKVRKAPQKEFESALKKSQVVQERYMITKDRAKFWVSGIIFPIYDTDGLPTGFTKIICDISEQKEYEKRKDDFINTATHEIRSPITCIKVLADIVKNEAKNSKSATLKESIKVLNDQVDRLIELTRYLLDVSKIQNGKLKIKKELFDLSVVIERSVVTLQLSAPQHTFEIINNVKYKTYGDKERIRQVITNLLTNAVKYSPKEGKIIITCSENNGGIKVSVQDFGIGISKEDKNKIFLRFFRTPTAQKIDISGIGLGLYITRKIILVHNGKIDLTSIRGKGTTFFFTLPAKPKKLHNENVIIKIFDPCDSV